jgi:replicative DNA helicase
MPKPKTVESNLRDEQAEAALLSAALLEPKLVENEDFSARLFIGGENHLLADALMDMRARGLEPTPANILLHTKKEELAKLATKLTARSLGGSPQLLIARLEEVRQRSLMARIARELHDAAFEESVAPDMALDDFEQQIMNIRRRRDSGLRKGSDMREVLAEVKWRALNPTAIRGRSTGIPRLDELMDGLINGELVIVAGRPSVGESRWSSRWKCRPRP